MGDRSRCRRCLIDARAPLHLSMDSTAACLIPRTQRWEGWFYRGFQK